MSSAAQGRTALDLLSVELKGHLLDAAAEGEVYTWGNGANYQLGSGAVGLQLAPVRLEALHGMSVQAVAAAKFHSAAITKDGQLYTWGFGRGGRLGEGSSEKTGGKAQGGEQSGNEDAVQQVGTAQSALVFQ